MGNKWQTYRLGDIADIGSSKRIKMADYVSVGVPFYRSKEIIEKHKGNPISTELFITEEKFNSIRERFGAPSAGDILLTSVGTLGIPYQVTNADHFYFKDGNLTWFQNFKTSVNSRYLYFWLTSKIAKSKIDEVTIGSTQQALTIVALKSITIDLPPISIQNEIVKHIDSVSDKITLNRQINQTLEQMAQALFKSWFVDFDPVVDNALDAGFFDLDLAFPDELLHRAEARRAVRERGDFKPLPNATRKLFPAAFEECAEPSLGLGGWVPKGWQVQSIKDFANVTDFVANGSFAALKENVTLFDNPEYALYIRTTDFKNDFDKEKAKYIDKHAYDFLSKTKLSGAEVIISNVGDVGTVFRPPSWLGIPMTLGSNAIAISTRCLNDYLYFYFSSQAGQSAIDGIVSGSAQQKFNKTGFRSLRLLLPDNNVVTKFNEVYQDISLKIISNKQNIRHLEQLRDTLLPKLISGELRLDNIEADLTTEEVA